MALARTSRVVGTIAPRGIRDLIRPSVASAAQSLMRARLLRSTAKVRPPDFAPVLLGKDVQERREEIVLLLAPDGVGDVQLKAAVVLACRPFPSGSGIEVQGVESGVQLVLGKEEAEGVLDLALRLAPGPGVGHGEGKGNAVGGVEEVALSLGEGAVQIEGEGGVPAHQIGQLRLRRPGLAGTQRYELRRDRRSRDRQRSGSRGRGARPLNGGSGREGWGGSGRGLRAIRRPCVSSQARPPALTPGRRRSAPVRAPRLEAGQ